jgi:hypothetical protein
MQAWLCPGGVETSPWLLQDQGWQRPERNQVKECESLTQAMRFEPEL